MQVLFVILLLIIIALLLRINLKLPRRDLVKEHAGLKWMIDKVSVNERLYAVVVEASSIIINQDVINECTK